MEAPKESIRRQILDHYKELGLPTKPNIGDNGVHASASPFEGLVERMNWLGTLIDTDNYGKGLLACGITKETIEQWSQDIQVTIMDDDDETTTTPSGKTVSIFDTLEDLDADDSLTKVSKIQ